MGVVCRPSSCHREDIPPLRIHVSLLHATKDHFFEHRPLSHHLPQARDDIQNGQHYLHYPQRSVHVAFPPEGRFLILIPRQTWSSRPPVEEYPQPKPRDALPLRLTAQGSSGIML